MSRHTVCLFFSLCLGCMICAEEAKRPSEVIQDNSFLLEEAYNQDAGVVQHILTLSGSVNRMPGADDRQWLMSFTQEWPLFGQTHQLSYTVPYAFNNTGGVKREGIGDMLLNYRLQLSTETASRPAIAPRLSVILPTGDKARGLGSGSVGFQTNVAASKVLSDRWTVHANAGMTVLPSVNRRNLTGWNLGASAIYAVTPSFNLMAECVANWDEDADETGTRSHSFSVLFSPGVRYGWKLRGDAQLVVGVAAPIGLTRDAPDYGIFFYCSLEHFFARDKQTGK